MRAVVFILCFCAAHVFAHECGTVATKAEYVQHRAMSENDKGTRQSLFERKHIFPTVNHVFASMEGEVAISSVAVRSQFQFVNEMFDDINIEFVFPYQDAIHFDDAGFDRRNKETLDLTIHETYAIPGAFNVYWAKYLLNDLCGQAWMPWSTALWRRGMSWMRAQPECLVTTLVHEIGHNFGLVHTQGPDDSNPDELVDGSNCDTAGDMLCDTPADPVLTNRVTRSCEYTGDLKDANGGYYRPDTSLIMSYSHKQCRTKFTPMQYALMHSSIPYLAEKYLSLDLSVHVIEKSSTCKWLVLEGTASHAASEWRYSLMDSQGNTVFDGIESMGMKAWNETVDRTLLGGTYYALLVACFPYYRLDGQQVCMSDVKRVEWNAQNIHAEGIRLQVTDASCVGAKDGAIRLIEPHSVGHSPPSKIVWSDGTTDADEIRSLPAGRYSVSLTYSNGSNKNHCSVEHYPLVLFAQVNVERSVCG